MGDYLGQWVDRIHYKYYPHLSDQEYIGSYYRGVIWTCKICGFVSNRKWKTEQHINEVHEQEMVLE